MQTSHYIYILTSFRRTLYVGSTNNLIRRLEQHRSGAVSSFTCRYNVNILVFAEIAESAEAAFARERQIKGWKRAKKITLIESVNPRWHDLSSRLIV